MGLGLHACVISPLVIELSPQVLNTAFHLFALSLNNKTVPITIAQEYHIRKKEGADIVLHGEGTLTSLVAVTSF